MTEYSEDLILSTIKCFAEENGCLLTREMAIEYLNNLSGLFIAFLKISKPENLPLNTEFNTNL